MPSVPVKDMSGSDVGEITLAESVFAAEANPVVVREVYNAYMANQRQGTHATKGWNDVSGGGSKPWKQKGTGRARTGSIRAPQWRGGAIIHGPQPRSYRQATPAKKRRLATRSVLSSRCAEGAIRIVDSLDVSNEPKTRRVAALLEALGATGSVLIVTEDKNELLLRAARNLPYVMVQVAGSLSIYELLLSDTVVMTRAAAELLQEKLA